MYIEQSTEVEREPHHMRQLGKTQRIKQAAQSHTLGYRRAQTQKPGLLAPDLVLGQQATLPFGKFSGLTTWILLSLTPYPQLCFQ